MLAWHWVEGDALVVVCLCVYNAHDVAVIMVWHERKKERMKFSHTKDCNDDGIVCMWCDVVCVTRKKCLLVAFSGERKGRRSHCSHNNTPNDDEMITTKKVVVLLAGRSFFRLNSVALIHKHKERVLMLAGIQRHNRLRQSTPAMPSS